MPAIRAVCIRLAEMVADQRHYLAPLPEHFGQAAWIVVLGQTGKRIDLSSESAKKAVRWLSVADAMPGKGRDAVSFGV